MSVRVCSEPGCPTLVEGGGRCDPCRKAYRRRADRRRPNATQRGYTSAHWRRTRERFLEVFTQCVDCGDTATVPDHDPVSRSDLVRMGIPDPDAWEFLRPRCEHCHNCRTAATDGAFGR